MTLRVVSIAGVKDAVGGEQVFAEFDAFGWRYTGVEVEYEHRTVYCGGPLLAACAAVWSAVVNRRRRQEAARLAAPQWRALGPLHVAVTPRRLLVWHGGAWWSVWFDAVVAAMFDAAEALTLLFDADAPYRFEGPDVAALAALVIDLEQQRGSSSVIGGRLP